MKEIMKPQINTDDSIVVIPVISKREFILYVWIPAFAGMTFL